MPSFSFFIYVYNINSFLYFEGVLHENDAKIIIIHYCKNIKWSGANQQQFYI